MSVDREPKVAHGIIEDERSVTGIVLKAMSAAPSARLREVMEAFTRHMHAFAREVRLTEEEFELGLEFLNRIGQASNDAHNEAVLFSDTIGFSTLVCLLNNGQAGATETASALLGPFWRMNSPHTENGGSIVRSPTPGPALFASGRVTDPQGRPLAAVERCTPAASATDCKVAAREGSRLALLIPIHPFPIGPIPSQQAA